MASIKTIVISNLEMSEFVELSVRESGETTLVDASYILATLRLGAMFLATGDRAACNRAIRLGIKCINHRTGEEHAPP